jgi:8-oxo-(d)GTP phosphatase
MAVNGDDVIRAAGALLWRPGPDGAVEVALVHRPKYDDWSLPKGKLSPGEHVLLAAVREVEEETGHRVTLGRPLPTQRYLVTGRPKEVRYWAAASRSGGRFVPSAEVDDLHWEAPREAARRLTQPRDAELVEDFAGGPLTTVPLILLRHAKAMRRSDWAGEDETRPLDPTGDAQAQTLQTLLSCFAPNRLLSSDTRRCLDTVLPYATAARLTVETEPLVSDSGFARHTDAALVRAERLLSATEPTLVCTHRPVLPTLAATLCARSRVRAPGGALDPGGFWVLHLSGGSVVAVETHSVSPCVTAGRS